MTGKKPVDPANSSETDRLARTVLGDILAMRKSHDAQVALSSDSSHIYLAESFSNRVSMQRCVDAVQRTLSADKDFSHPFQAWRDRIQQTLIIRHCPEADKEGFLQGAEKAIGGSTS